MSKWNIVIYLQNIIELMFAIQISITSIIHCRTETHTDLY